ncbi:MAG TPA: ATP-grasp domain-containing protein [Streptosporangiaceae bacterium]|nr:ATP-grasp domain-containing protein [Streptosporangiaceae bacterium]
METRSYSTGSGLPLLLIIGPGVHRFREYLFQSISTRYDIHVMNSVEPTWEVPYLSGATVVPDMSAATLVAAAQHVAARQSISGVLTFDEARVLPTAHVAAALGLPGGNPEAAEHCRDKYLTRSALEKAGLSQPGFGLVGDLPEALAAADRIGYPVVIKPRGAAASYGVVRVDGAQELASKFTFSRDATVPDAPHYEQAVLVEEYLQGPEVSIDSCVQHGKVTPMYVARKEVGFAPYFEETGHTVDACDPLLADGEVRKTLQEMHEAIGFVDGWTHTEFKLTADGPKIIEVNGRLGGDLIPYLGQLASGNDPGVAAAAAACGTPPATAAERSLVAGVCFLYAERDGATIEAISFDETGFHPAVHSAVVLARPGDVVSLPPKGIVSGRVAFAIAVADTLGECRAALRSTQSSLSVRLAD